MTSHNQSYKGQSIKDTSSDNRKLPTPLINPFFSMEEVDRASAASKHEMKRLIDDLDRTRDILRKARDRIAQEFKDLKEERDALAAENGVPDVDGSETLKINAGGNIISVTRDTLTQIKGTRLEDLFGGRWDKHLPRDRDGVIFMDVNPVCFQAVVDYLNERKSTPPDCPPGLPHVGEENDVVLQQLLLEFGLIDDEMIQSHISVRKQKLRNVKSGSDACSEASQDTWQTMKFDCFPQEAPFDFKTILEEEQKALIEQQLLIEKENNCFKFFIKNETENIVWLDVSGTLMATKRSTLGLCEDSVLAKQFNDPLWMQQDKRTLTEQWSCEEVAGWVATIKGMPDDVGPALVRNYIDGAALLIMGQEDFKDIGVTNAGSLVLLLKEIAGLRSEVVFIDHSAYCFGKILDTLRLRAMCQTDKTLPPSVFIKEPKKEHFEAIVDYYFPGEFSSFILPDIVQGKKTH